MAIKSFNRTNVVPFDKQNSKITVWIPEEQLEKWVYKDIVPSNFYYHRPETWYGYNEFPPQQLLQVQISFQEYCTLSSGFDVYD